MCVLEGGGGGKEGFKRGENIRSKHEQVPPKHDLIGCQTWHDWLSII